MYTDIMRKRSSRTLTARQVTNCLTSWHEEATPAEIKAGLDWYSEAQGFVHQTYDDFKDLIPHLTKYIVAGIVSALSPNNRWERNKVDTITVLKAIVAGLPPDSVKVCTYNPNKLKAFEIAKGDIEITSKSPKTHSFAMNVGLLSPDHITIDKHHLRACVTRPKDGIVDCMESCTANEYRRIESVTAELAHKLGYKGYELQAIIWVTIKRVWNR